MNYFRLEYSLDKGEIGDYPQIQKFKKGYNPNRRESCSQIGRYFFGKKPDVEIDFDCLEMTSKAKLTDYLSASYLNPLTGLLVSSNMFKFLSDLILPDYISYETSIYQKGHVISKDYKWVHFTGFYPEIIDYSKSYFYLDHSETNYIKIAISSYPEYVEAQKNSKYKINAKRLVLKPEMANKFDVIRLGIVRNEVYITEIVKNKMVSNGFSGIIYEPAHDLIVG